MKRATASLSIAATLVALWTAGAAAAPQGWLRLVYASVCHQLPGRCLNLAGHPMAVCARCLGIYLGVLVALALGVVSRSPQYRRSGAVWLGSAVALNGADAGLAFIGAPALANGPRVVLGLALGVAAGVIVVHGLAEILDRPLGAGPLVPVRPAHADRTARCSQES